MSPRKRRAVVLNSVATNTSALVAAAVALGEEHDEVVLAIEGADMLRRWMCAHALLADHRSIFATPLAPCAHLTSLEDRCAALVARLGSMETLLVDSSSWLACARTLGFPAQLLESSSTTADASLPLASNRGRALVVTRAQPFHLGHLALIEHGLESSEEVVVVIAAAERSYARRDPYTAGERLALIRSGLEHLLPRVWLAALPSPPWPAMALAQLAFVVPSFDRIVAHNPVLRAMGRQAGKLVAGLTAPIEVSGRPISGTRIRARLETEGAGDWLDDYLPRASAVRLRASAVLSERCALIARAGG